jgi:Tfp pilus assembly protein PilX
MTSKSFKPARHQAGNTLLIAVVLLLLAGVMTVLAMNVGIFEQRSTANDVRAKAVHEVAEAGLAQGAEYLLRQHTEMLTFPDGTGTWTACADDKFPCGVIGTAAVDADGDPATTGTVTRRSTMYRLTNSGATIANLDSVLVSRMLPLAQAIPSVGSGFTVAYGVAPVMCFVANRHPDEPANSPIRCATDADEASERRIVTFVSVASIVGENARTTLTQTVGRYPLLASPAGAPPILASGSIDITGGLQVVTNPNSGGTGVPVSVWTRQNIDKTGTPNTCYADEFFRFGAKNNDPPVFSTGEVKTILCDTCQCEGDQSLSYDRSGNAQDEGIDILDVEGTSADRGTGVNYNVRSDAASYPLCEFPPDLFAHLFGEPTWDDTDEDCFGETKITRQFENPNTGAVVTLGADEAYLYENAKTIYATTANQGYLKDDQQPAVAWGANLSSLSGVVWCQTGCSFSPSAVVGSVDNPVVLVVDGATDFKGKLYGILFVRATGAGPLDPDTGGNATLRMNSNAVVYGAVVVQGEVEKANGTSAVVYNMDILNQINRNEDNNRFATLPGAWNDRSTY